MHDELLSRSNSRVSRPSTGEVPNSVRTVSELLILWRTEAPEYITAVEIARLRSLLQGVELLREPRWHAARNGDAAMVAALSIEHAGGSGTYHELIMANALLAALRGDPTARMIIVHDLQRLSRRDPSAAAVARLATRWKSWGRVDRTGRRGSTSSLSNSALSRPPDPTHAEP